METSMQDFEGMNEDQRKSIFDEKKSIIFKVTSETISFPDGFEEKEYQSFSLKTLSDFTLASILTTVRYISKNVNYYSFLVLIRNIELNGGSVKIKKDENGDFLISVSF